MKNLKIRMWAGVLQIIFADILIMPITTFLMLQWRDAGQLLYKLGVVLAFVLIDLVLIYYTFCSFFMYIEITDETITWVGFHWWMGKRSFILKKNKIAIADIAVLDVRDGVTDIAKGSLGNNIYVTTKAGEEVRINLGSYFNFDREEIIKRVYEIKKQIEEKSKQEEIELFDRSDLQQINKF